MPGEAERTGDAERGWEPSTGVSHRFSLPPLPTDGRWPANPDLLVLVPVACAQLCRSRGALAADPALSPLVCCGVSLTGVLDATASACCAVSVCCCCSCCCWLLDVSGDRPAVCALASDPGVARSAGRLPLPSSCRGVAGSAASLNRSCASSSSSADAAMIPLRALPRSAACAPCSRHWTLQIKCQSESV